MYRYDEFDHQLVRERVEQFAGQVERRVKGELSEEQFKPLRLMNGLYLQLHAYMLRVAIPYGTLASRQMRMLAQIARRYDRGYGHFTTRQNIQYNWPKLPEVPAILRDLASVEMHAIQTSGNCIRNVTADPYAAAIDGEVEDPRPLAETIRQWSSFHPEFSYLPRKFKIAVTGHARDRAAIAVHDIGIAIKQRGSTIGYQVFAGGGQGRTPFLGKCLDEFVRRDKLFPYLEAVMRVYNRWGRRDNLFKARIKILVHELGAERMRAEVAKEFRRIDAKKVPLVPPAEMERIAAYFAPPNLERQPARSPDLEAACAKDQDFAQWVRTNLVPHRQPGYAIVNVTLKPIGGIPGDASAAQMDALADLAEQYAQDEIRVTHTQNLVLPHVKKSDVHALYQALKPHQMATANLMLVSDIIACPGLDFCNLANARSIPLAQRISERFRDLERQYEIGPLQIKISGCINACGHHHVGHIGILGVDKKGTEYYQLSLGGSADEQASLGQIVGPAFTEDRVVDAVEKIVEVYLRERRGRTEEFIAAWRRLGIQPFKDALACL